MRENIIRSAPNQSFEAMVRYVNTLAEGERVDIDTSRYPYAVRVDDATFKRWLAALPKAKQDPDVPASQAEKPDGEVVAVQEPAPEPESPVVAGDESPEEDAKPSVKKRAGARRKRGAEAGDE